MVSHRGVLVPAGSGNRCAVRSPRTSHLAPLNSGLRPPTWDVTDFVISTDVADVLDTRAYMVYLYDAWMLVMAIQGVSRWMQRREWSGA